MIASVRTAEASAQNWLNGPEEEVVLRGLHIVRRAKAVECGLEDGLEVAGVGGDRGDGDDHVEDLLEREVVADFMCVLCGGEKRPAGGDHSGAVAVE